MTPAQRRRFAVAGEDRSAFHPIRQKDEFPTGIPRSKTARSHPGRVSQMIKQLSQTSDRGTEES
jgi:hypothetical protein